MDWLLDEERENQWRVAVNKVGDVDAEVTGTRGSGCSRICGVNYTTAS